MKYKFRYLVIREKPYNLGKTVAQIDVSYLNTNDLKTKMSELEKTFLPELYDSCILSSNQEKGEFIINNK